MGRLTEEVFNESCCDGGVCNTTHESAQPCGCDPGANWVCDRHKHEGLVGWNAMGGAIKKYVPENGTSESVTMTVYNNPLEKHLAEVVNVSWNGAGRCKTWEDHVWNAVSGLVGEAGEVADLHKKMFFHSADIDRYDELINELGDVCFYLAKVMELHGTSLEEVLHANKTKLHARYPQRFAGVAK